MRPYGPHMGIIEILTGVGVGGECLLSFSSLGHEDSGSGFGVDGLLLGVV
jgi:hypothetical protein